MSLKSFVCKDIIHIRLLNKRASIVWIEEQPGLPNTEGWSFVFTRFLKGATVNDPRVQTSLEAGLTILRSGKDGVLVTSMLKLSREMVDLIKEAFFIHDAVDWKNIPSGEGFDLEEISSVIKKTDLHVQQSADIPQASTCVPTPSSQSTRGVDQ